MKDDGSGKAGAVATTFGPTDHIHALAKLNKLDREVKGKVSWVAEKVPFFDDGEVLFEKDLSALVANQITTDADVSNSEPLGGEWQPGTYRLDVLLDGKLAKSAEFTVADPRPVGIRSLALFKDDGTGSRSSQPSTTFAPTDRKIYTVALTTGAKVDSTVHPKFQWVASGSAGQKDQVLKEIEVGAFYANRLNGNLSLVQDWPAGKYQLNVLFDSEVAKSVPFEVK
jgi:hypothetical protein